ncbi:MULTISPECIES: discoidin domain-containing protein [Lysinibacillus]|jgi:hypothetical protein|uniref:discoidin domain-containing protein n=1 Tax=Lysinibacillus TaxID=400634 RepID=UPI0004D45AE1|nr:MULTISPECIES: discoidin domain-containing protein [Lysinibacillus]AJK88689.1 hypothetical protein HR49_16900 [Lysinibacillus fusiformis]KHK55237.1 hypothetical protein PI85_03395 [Lysinibacillus sp. A1]UXJ70201.1 discoidin domain-containing protein [Lysinibacillus fusiformis]
MDIVTSYDNWGGKGDRRSILSGNSEVFDGTETTYLGYYNGQKATIDIVFSGLEGKLYIDCIKVIRTGYALVDREVLLNDVPLGAFAENVDQPLSMLKIKKGDKLTIKGRNNQSGGGTYWTYVREIELKTHYVPDKSFIYQDGAYKKWDIGTPEYTSTNVVPVMTSNSAPAPFVISSSSEQSSFPSWRAFNGILSETTAWMTENGVVSNAWIQVKLNSPRILAELKVTSRNGLGYDTHSPKDFNLLGSNDGSNWETIISISNQINWGSGESRKYLFNNSNSFIFYRLLVESNNGGVIIAIGEIELIGKALSAVPSHWETVSNTLPKSNQFLEKGMYLSPLLDRRVGKLEPIPMTQRKDILDAGEFGKIFSNTIDLKKYFDIRSIRVEVK